MSVSPCLASLALLAWSFFGRAPESSAKRREPSVQEAVSNAVQQAVQAAVAEAAQKAAAAAAAEKVAREAKEAEEKAAREAARAEAKEKRAQAREDREMAAKAEAEQRALELENLQRIESRIFRLEHASAEEVAEKLNVMWSGDFGTSWKISKMAVAFPESNSIMMTAPRAIIAACEQSLRELDVEAPQVYIEARFVELGNSASHKVGIDWSGIAGGTPINGSRGVGFQQPKFGQGVKNYKKESVSRSGSSTTTETFDLTGEKGADGAVNYFNGTLNISQMSLTLSALDATEDAKTFSNPKIIVSSGKKATVDMTTKYPNVKISTKRTTGTSDSVDIASNLEAIPGEDKFMFAKEAFFSWGISLEVTPRISTNGLINVSIVPTISSRDLSEGDSGWVMTGTMDSSGDDGGTVSTKYPIIKVQRLVSEFNLESGTTAVIGGLSITTEKQVDNGIPLLRDIPWIGPRIFGSKARVKEQKEIIVFVTVGLVNPRQVSPDAGLPKNAVLGRQYTKGQKLEPGDRPEKNMEGFDSLDLRPLEEQARDPLRRQDRSVFDLSDYIPFKKDPNYRR